MARQQDFKGQVTKALKSAGLYSDALAIQINSLASSMPSLAKANSEIEALDGVLLESTTTQGTTRQVHPAFKVQRDMIDLITRQMKQLGLTTAELVGKPDIPDAADELLARVNAIQ